MPMNLHTIHATAVETARAAGALLRDGYGQKPDIQHKSAAGDWVTQFDLAAEALISDRLTRAFPDHAIMAEESGSNHRAGPWRWYVDPLDGTNNFAHGLPAFCVSLALWEATKPRVGVVYDPLRDECFSAIAGQGAWLTTGGARRPLAVSQTAELVYSLVATGFPYDKHTSAVDNIAQTAVFLKRIQGLRRSGAAALDLAYVAAGRLDGYWEQKLNSWDAAAGVLLVQEAGGQVTLLGGEPFALTPKLSLTASNGRIHAAMLATLAAAAPGAAA
jgi:myo-inositol-1(or 4)-monophosphatase